MGSTSVRVPSLARLPQTNDPAELAEFRAAEIQRLSQENETQRIALDTLSNVLACALRCLVELGEGSGPDEVWFSRQLSDRMTGVRVTVSEAPNGAVVAHLRERSPHPIALDG